MFLIDIIVINKLFEWLFSTVLASHRGAMEMTLVKSLHKNYIYWSEKYSSVQSSQCPTLDLHMLDHLLLMRKSL
jgi:hypothetical protein